MNFSHQHLQETDAEINQPNSVFDDANSEFQWNYDGKQKLSTNSISNHVSTMLDGCDRQHSQINDIKNKNIEGKDLTIDILQNKQKKTQSNQVSSNNSSNVITQTIAADTNFAASIPTINPNQNQSNQVNPNNQEFSDNDSDHIRDLIYAVLRTHTIGFFLFLFILLYVKFFVPYYYALAFLWVVDLYGIICGINLILDNLEAPENKSDHIVSIMENILNLIYKILLIISLEYTGLYMIFSLIPLGILIIAKIAYLSWKKKIEANLFTTIFMTIQILSISLKYDEIVDWDWREVFWAFWIIFSLMIGVTFAMVLLFLSKCATYLFSDTQRHEIRGMLWITYVIGGITVLSCAFVITVINYFDVRSYETTSRLSNTLYAIICYCLMAILMTLSYLRDIEYFLNKVLARIIQKSYNRKFLVSIFPADDVQILSKKKVNRKNQEKIEIPKFLMKISSTYFGKATEDDVKDIESKKNASPNTLKKAKKLKHLRTNSFDYARLTKNSEFTTENTGTMGNVGTINSARYKKSSDQPKQNNIEGELKLDNPSIVVDPQIASPTSNHSEAPNSNDAEPSMTINQEFNSHKEEIRREYPIDYEIIENNVDGRGSIKINNENNQIKPIDQKPNSGTKPHHRKFQSASILMRPKIFPIIEEAYDDTNRSKADISNIAAHQSSPFGQTDRSVSACLICFDKMPDAVFMECGHGGVCYQCSIEVWKATGECYLCRKQIQQVLQLDLTNYGKSKVIKVISSTQAVNSDDENDLPDGGDSSLEANNYN